MAIKIRAILFDLDDTLIPTEALYEQGLRRAWKAFNRRTRISWTRFLKAYQRAREDVKGALGAVPAARNRVLYFKRFIENTVGHSDPAFTLALIKAFDEVWETIQSRPLEHLATLLASRYKLGIVTNQLGLMQLQKMANIDPQGKWFKVLVTAEEVGVEKPDPKIYREALKRLGATAAQTLFVSNSAESDLRGAKRLGFQLAHWTPGSTEKTSIPGMHRVSSLEGLLRLVIP